MHHSCGRGSAMKSVQSGGWDVYSEVIAGFTPNFTSLTTEALQMLTQKPPDVGTALQKLKLSILL